MSLPPRFSGLRQSPFVELMTGSAHQPRSADATVPLKERFADKPLLLVMVARERAATLRVYFDGEGRAQLGESRQIVARHAGDLGRILQLEAQKSGSSWALIVLALGWQVELGLRSVHSSPDFRPLDRFLLPSERPDLFVSQPRAELAYAVVDHPSLDRSLVFSCKRKELDAVVQEVEGAGLGVAGIRLGVASQLELWFEGAGEQALKRDILVSDGMSVLLLNVKDGDFTPPVQSAGGLADSPPRQASARPNDLAQDMARFARDNGMRPITCIGPAELASTFPLVTALQGIEVLRPDIQHIHDSALASLAEEVRHDLRTGIRGERPAIHAKWRPWILFYLSLFIIVAGLSGYSVFRACDGDQARTATIGKIQEAQRREARALAALDAYSKESNGARDLKEWVASGYHAQGFLHQILSELPDGVSLDRIAAQLEGAGPQLSLEFTLLGGEELQIAATRAIEKAVLALDCQIGERHAPVPVSNTGLAHRWRLILPAEMKRKTR